MALNTTWLPLFAQLRRLEKLVWYVPRDAWWGPLFPDQPRPSVPILTLITSDEFRSKVLHRCHERMVATFWVETELGYARISECEDTPFLYNDGLYAAPFSTPYRYDHMAEGAFGECFCEDCLRMEEMN